MAYESLANDIDKIEELLAKGESLKSIAAAIGKPSSRALIGRYKKEIFDLNAVANAAWLKERQKSRAERMEEGKDRIVNDLELLNTMKLNAETLSKLKLGDTYETADGQTRTMSYGSLAIHWEAGARIGIQAIKQSQEIAGDDPESRKAETLLELINAVEGREGSQDG